MANLINAYVLYNGKTGIYVGNNVPSPTISINCERLRAFSPRPVWLKRFSAPGDGTVILYEPTFNPTSDELLDPNTLTGFWIEQDGQDVMIDVTTVAAFQEACDACCGEVPTIVAGTYNGSPTDFTPLTVNTICVYSFDDGSAGAHDNFASRYVGQFVGKAILRSNFSGLSHYSLQTYWTYLTFPKQGTDVVYNGVCGS